MQAAERRLQRGTYYCILNKQKGSGLLLVVIITAVLSCYITQYSLLNWQQTKLTNLEKIRIEELGSQYKAVNQAIDYIGDFLDRNRHDMITYQKLSHHIDKYNITYTPVTRKEHENTHNRPNSIIYRIDIRSFIDSMGIDEYHKKLHFYLYICEYEELNNFSDELEAHSVIAKHRIKVFPLSSINFN